MNIKYLIKKAFFNWFGKAKYQKKLKEYDIKSKEEFSNYVASNAPYTEFTNINHLYEVLQEGNIPDDVIKKMFNTITSDGWYFVKGYFHLIQESIEKRLVFSDITDREFIARRVEHSVYQKIFAFDEEIRDKFKEIQEKEANQKLSKSN